MLIPRNPFPDLALLPSNSVFFPPFLFLSPFLQLSPVDILSCPPFKRPLPIPSSRPRERLLLQGGQKNNLLPPFEEVSKRKKYIWFLS